MLSTRLSVCQSNYDGLTQVRWGRWELTTASAQLTSNSYNGDVRMLKVQHQTHVFTMRGESLKRAKLLVTTWTTLSITCALEWQTQSCSISCTVQSKGEFTNSQSATVTTCTVHPHRQRDFIICTWQLPGLEFDWAINVCIKHVGTGVQIM